MAREHRRLRRITEAGLLACAVAIATRHASAQQPPPRPPLVIAAPADAPPSGLRVYSIALMLTVAEGEDVAARLKSIAASAGGQTLSCSMDRCMLKAPVERIDQVVHEAGLLGRADRPNVTVEDVTERYVDLSSRIAAISRMLEDLQALEKRQASTSEALRLVGEQERLRREAVQLQLQARQLAEASRLAVFTITVEHPLRAPGESIEFRLPIPWLTKLGYGHLINPPQTWKKSRSGIDGRFNLSIGGTTKRERMDVAATTHVGGDLRGGGSAKGKAIGWALGLDGEIGAGWGSGVLYAGRVYVGPGLFFGNRTMIALMPGIGGSAIRGGALPGAGEVPVEVAVATDLGRRLRVRLFTRPQWVFGSKGRQDGISGISVFDEWTHGGWLAFGRRRSDRNSSGLVVGFTIQQAMGAVLTTGSIGYTATAFEGDE
jgi:hypothetical protein